MKNNITKILDCILKLKWGKRENRANNFLKSPESEHAEGWYMYVPKCFNTALDIKYNKCKKTWSQGSAFSFKIGDTIYNTPMAYEQWSKALKYINICISIKQALSARPAWKNEKRYSGLIHFSILVPNKAQTNLIERDEYQLTQDDFVILLIQGSSKESEINLKKLNRPDTAAYRLRQF